MIQGDVCEDDEPFRFIFAQHLCPMAVNMFDNVLSTITEVRQFWSIKRQRQLAVSKAVANNMN